MIQKWSEFLRAHQANADYNANLAAIQSLTNTLDT